MSTTKRITKRLIAVVLTVLMLMSMVTIGMTSASAAYVDLAQTGANMTAGSYLYLKPNSNWTQSSAWFAMYVWGTDAATWVKMEKVDDSSATVYRGLVPAGTRDKVIFCRMNPSATALDWASKWDQSQDLTYGGTNNCWAPAAGQWNNATGSWSIYTPPATVPAEPTDVKVAVTGVEGLGTAESPYIVESGSKVTFNISANKGTATGIGYALDGGSKTQATTLEVDAPAEDEIVTYKVDVYTYNTSGTDTKWSATAVPVNVTLQAKAEVEEITYGTEFAIDWAEEDGLYVYAGDADKITEENQPDTEAWQRWLEKSTDNRVVYLPASANAEKVAIFNAYKDTVYVGDTPISAGRYEIFNYVEGTEYSTIGTGDQTLTIYRTDAEVSLFINTDKEAGSVVNDDDNKTEKNLSALEGQNWYEYLVSGATKNREAKMLGGAVAFDDGVVVEAVKKIKGRGNTTWEQEIKKPFNITFNSKIAIDGMDKFGKWSLLANAKDDSLMRNRLVYDMANEVNMKYACDSRFVDFFVDGRYMGAYQLVQKIEMKSGSVMSDLDEPDVEDEYNDDGTIKSEYPRDNFDFVLELDTQKNADNAGDKTFKTSRNQVMTHKIPDEPAEEQVAFMKDKYQALEDAIYGDDLAALESIIDINDFVRAYLVNEVAKNIDAGVTSCYFVYNSNEGKFYASPVWDYDNAVGNMAEGRKDKNGNPLSLIDTAGWYSREMKHFDEGFKGGQSIFSQAYYMTSKTADGKTFADIAAEIWAADFANIDDILAGDIKAEHGRLKSIEEYKALLAKSGKWNYEKTWKADNGWTLTQNWTADHSKLTMYDYDAESNTYTVTGKTYKENVPADMNQFVGDWLISRINWIDVQYNEAEEVLPEGYINVYFQNNWKWTDVRAHVWTPAGDITTWPGMALELVGNDGTYDVYSIAVPEDASIIFSGIKDDGSGKRDQTPDIDELVNDACYYMVWADGNAVGTKTIQEVLPDLFKPDDPIDPDDPVVEKMNIFLNATAWAQNGATYTVHYVVPAEGEGEGVATASIGEDTAVMSLIADNVYVAEIPANATNVQFAKNTVSNDELAVATVVTTDLLTIENGKNYYTITDVNAEEGTITGSWSVYGAEPDVDPEIPAVGTVVVYVVNSKNWETVNAYIWSGSGDTAEPAVEWPGVALQPTGEKSTYGSDVYAMTFESKYTSVLFNNGTLKTKDLTVKDGQYYDLSNGQWYETLVEVPEPLPVPDPVTVYFQNNWLWTEVSVYAYDADGIELMGGWPGQAMELYGNDGTYDIYKAVVPGEATTIIFNGVKDDGSGERNQSPNITDIVANRCYYMDWKDGANTFGYKDIDVILPPAMTTVYLNVAGVWNVADGIVTVDDAVMENIHGTFYKAEIREDATEITFSLTQTSVEEGASVTKLTVPATRVEGKDLFTLTAVDAGEWGVYEEPVKPVDRTIYLAINGIWEGSVPAVVYNGETIALTAVEGEEEIYTATIKYVEGIEDIVFIYSVEFDDNVPTVLEPEKDLFTLLEVEESEGAVTVSGTWSVYGEEIPDDPDMPTVVTVKVINSANWDEVYAYVWADEEAVKWPGTEMDLTEETVNGFDIYALSFNSAYTKIIFNNNDNGQKTDDLTVTDGYYYDVATKEWYATLEDVPTPDPLATGNYLVGSWDNWDAIANQFMLKEEGDRVGYVTLDLEAGEYEFKVIRHGEWASCKDVPAITETTNNITVSTGVTGNCVLTVEEAGTYTFAFASKDSLLAVTYPGDELAIPDEKVVDNNYYIRSDFAGEWGDLVLEGEGTVLTATAELEYGTYQFKITQNGKWYGNNGTIEDTCEGWHFKEKDAEGNDTKDCTLKATGGTYTFTFDTETMMLTVTAELTPPEFEVTYNSGNFTFEGDETATLDEAYTFTVTPEDGFVIAAVIYDMEELEAVDGVYTIENVQGDINLYIVTALESSTPPNSKFTVIFLKDDGSIYATRKEIQPGTLHPLPPAPYKEGYIFKGWSPEVEIVKNDAGQDCIEVTKDYVFSPVFEEDTNDLPLIPGPTDPPVEPEVKTYTVIFIDDNNKFIEFQTVEEGKDATLPEAPARAGYTFKEWSGEYTNVTENRTIVAVYTKNEVTPPAPATEGTLKVDVAGGTGFIMTVNGVDRPQGTSYYTQKMAINTTITVTAKASTGAKFIGWANASNGSIVSIEESYTFLTSGNDAIKAIYEEKIDGVGLVIFKHDKLMAGKGQIIDMQYYASTDSIIFPNDPVMGGYDFLGWKMSESDIQASIAKGDNVIVLPEWKLQDIYYEVSVEGGKVTYGDHNSAGHYRANQKTIITADAPASGMKFAYWVELTEDGEKIAGYRTDYTFYPKKDLTFKAIFVENSVDINYQMIQGINNITTNGYKDNENEAIVTFSMQWDVPADGLNVQFVKAGLIAVSKDKFNESTFHSTTTDSNVYNKNAGSTEYGSYSWNKRNIFNGDTWILQTYVMYKDASGNTHTEYGERIEYTRVDE